MIFFLNKRVMSFEFIFIFMLIGSLFIFVDVGSNFVSLNIIEDNIIL